MEESAGPAIAQQQLRRKNIGRSYEKMLLKCGITKSERKAEEEPRTENVHTLRCQVSASRLHPQPFVMSSGAEGVDVRER